MLSPHDVIGRMPLRCAAKFIAHPGVARQSIYTEFYTGGAVLNMGAGPSWALPLFRRRNGCTTYRQPAYDCRLPAVIRVLTIWMCG